MVIVVWSRLVENCTKKQRFIPEDKYNFDETGFQVGQIATTRVVALVETKRRPKQSKPSNTEWATSSKLRHFRGVWSFILHKQSPHPQKRGGWSEDR